MLDYDMEQIVKGVHNCMDKLDHDLEKIRKYFPIKDEYTHLCLAPYNQEDIRITVEEMSGICFAVKEFFELKEK